MKQELDQKKFEQTLKSSGDDTYDDFTDDGIVILDNTNPQ